MLQPIEPPSRRCAVYTRKSTNPALDHEITSIETQREICSAYVTSQRHKGWILLAKRYDDPGQPGTNFERPGLTELMRDIEAGQVDVVVIYKVDRLTRSLYDFVRLIEVFDRHDIGFVSISQSFDTSDSMGRMILNVLLTFSQFERELISERIRDNIQTRKRHGKWHGGMPPIGYELVKKRLVVLEPEAEIVRFVYRRFLNLGTYTAVSREAEQAGLRTQVKQLRNGGTHGGGLLNSSQIYAILESPTYIGEIRGREGNHPGEHEAIISRDLWEAVQAVRESRRRDRGTALGGKDHFLNGLLWDSYGRQMRLNVERYKEQITCFYVSCSAAWGFREGIKQVRSKAEKLESLVIASIATFLADREALRCALQKLGLEVRELGLLAAGGLTAAARLKLAEGEAVGAIITALVRSIELSSDHMTMTFRSIELKRFLEWRGGSEFHGRHREWSWSDAKHVIDIPVRAISDGRSPVVKIASRDPACAREPRAELVALVREARKAQRMVEERRERSMEELARTLGTRTVYFSRLLRLNYLAPDIVTAILDGSQPPELTRPQLLTADLPLDWALQRELFGFAPIRDRHRIEPRKEKQAGPGSKNMS